MQNEKSDGVNEGDNANTKNTNKPLTQSKLTATNLFNYLMYEVHKKQFKRKLDDARRALGEERFRECFYKRKKLTYKELNKLKKKNV